MYSSLSIVGIGNSPLGSGSTKITPVIMLPISDLDNVSYLFKILSVIFPFSKASKSSIAPLKLCFLILDILVE